MQQVESPLQQYLQIIRRQITIVLLVPLITIVGANALHEIRDPVYRAATTLVVGVSRGNEIPPQLATTSVTRTMTSLLEGDLVARNVIDKLDLDITTKDFQKDLKVEVLPDTSVLDVTYESSDQKRARNIVKELAAVFEARIGEALGVRGEGLEATRGGSFELVVRSFDPPHVEGDPVSPQRTATLILAGIAGLVLGLVLAVARDSLDFRIRARHEAEEWFGAPVVGALPKDRMWSSKLGRKPDDSRLESLDLLRARLQFSASGIAGPTILVTSPRTGEGKSTVTASLGAALARSGKRVICVDADLRRPTLHRHLGGDADAPGLSDVLEGSADVGDVLQLVDRGALPDGDAQDAGGNGHVRGWDAKSRLELLPAGSRRSSPSALFRPERLIALVTALRDRADYVVFDSPPLIAADSFVLARHSDNVLLVARSGRTTRQQAESARDTLEGLGVDKVSIVLTNAPPVETYT